MAWQDDEVVNTAPWHNDEIVGEKPPPSLLHNSIIDVRQAGPDAPLGQMAFWNKPADKTWGEYASAHFQPIDDMVRHATNVFGLGDRFAAKMDELTGTGPTVGELVKGQITGQPLDALSRERAKSAEADARMPTQNKLAADVIGSAPVAALGTGTRIADASAPYLAKLPFTGAGKWLGGVIGGGTEGVAMTEAGSYGRTDKGASPGELLLAASLGLPGGVASRSGKGVPPLDASTLEAAHDVARAPMTAIKFRPLDVTGAFDRSRAALTGPERGSLSKDMNDTFDNFKDEIAKGSASADDLNGYARKIFASVRNDSDRRLAGKVRESIHNDVMARTMPVSNHSVGEAANLNAKANEAFARVRDNEWLSETDITKAPGEALKRLNDPTKLYGPNEREALDTLSQFAPKSKAAMAPKGPWSGAAQAGNEAVGDIAKDKLAPGAAGWLLDGLWGGLGGIAASVAVKSGLGAWKGARNADIQRALEAAHATLTTGQKMSPADYIKPAVIRPEIRRGVTGVLAGGAPGL